MKIVESFRVFKEKILKCHYDNKVLVYECFSCNFDFIFFQLMFFLIARFSLQLCECVAVQGRKVPL